MLQKHTWWSTAHLLAGPGLRCSLMVIHIHLRHPTPPRCNQPSVLQRLRWWSRWTCTLLYIYELDLDSSDFVLPAISLPSSHHIAISLQRCKGSFGGEFSAAPLHSHSQANFWTVFSTRESKMGLMTRCPKDVYCLPKPASDEAGSLSVVFLSGCFPRPQQLETAS